MYVNIVPIFNQYSRNKWLHSLNGYINPWKGYTKPRHAYTEPRNDCTDLRNDWKEPQNDCTSRGTTEQSSWTPLQIRETTEQAADPCREPRNNCIERQIKFHPTVNFFCKKKIRQNYFSELRERDGAWFSLYSPRETEYIPWRGHTKTTLERILINKGIY